MDGWLYGSDPQFEGSQDINGTKSFGAKPFLNFGQVKAGEIHNKEAGQRLASLDDLWNDYQATGGARCEIESHFAGEAFPRGILASYVKDRVCVRRRLNRGDVNFSRCSICSKTR